MNLNKTCNHSSNVGLEAKLLSHSFQAMSFDLTHVKIEATFNIDFTVYCKECTETLYVKNVEIIKKFNLPITQKLITYGLNVALSDIDYIEFTCVEVSSTNETKLFKVEFNLKFDYVSPTVYNLYEHFTFTIPL